MSSELLLGSSDDLSGSLNIGSQQIYLGPVGEISGTAPPGFHLMKTIPSLNENVGPGPTDPTAPSLQFDAKGMVTSASSPGLGVDDLSSQGTTNIASAQLDLLGNPTSTLAVLGLTASATFIHSESDASYVFGANRGSVGGDASFGSLTIGGALVGGHTLTFSGQAAPNTVLYQSATVTITLDQQTLSDFFPPMPVVAGPMIPVTPNHIATNALDIQLNNANISGTLVSGNIALGQSSASYFSSPVVPPPIVYAGQT